MDAIKWRDLETVNLVCELKSILLASYTAIIVASGVNGISKLKDLT